MAHEQTTLTLPTGESVDADLWRPPEKDNALLSSAVILLSTPSEPIDWDIFAESLSRDRLVYRLHGVSSYRLLQALWAIDDSAAMISHGLAAGNVAMHTADIAAGAISALILADYYAPDGIDSILIRASCPIVLIRGRQSEISSHRQIVRTRNAIGEKCALIELDNCGDRVAESCPGEFEAAVRWSLRRQLVTD